MTKNEALDKIKKLLEESALGGRWSFTDQALALVAQIEADAAPAAPAPAATNRPPRCPAYVELRTDALEEVMRLLADAQSPRVRYDDEPVAMAREAFAAAQLNAMHAADVLREALPQYFGGERF
jgi:hypothetical protein